MVGRTWWWWLLFGKRSIGPMAVCSIVCEANNLKQISNILCACMLGPSANAPTLTQIKATCFFCLFVCLFAYYYKYYYIKFIFQIVDQAKKCKDCELIWPKKSHFIHSFPFYVSLIMIFNSIFWLISFWIFFFKFHLRFHSYILW